MDRDTEALRRELLEMVDTPLEEVKAFLSGMEDRQREAKRREIEACFHQQSAPLGVLAGEALTRALEILAMLGVDCEVLEDDRPSP